MTTGLSLKHSECHFVYLNILKLIIYNVECYINQIYDAAKFRYLSYFSKKVTKFVIFSKNFSIDFFDFLKIALKSRQDPTKNDPMPNFW